MARRGARAVQAEPVAGSASEAWREAVARNGEDEASAWEPDEVWVLDVPEDVRPGERTRNGPGRTGDSRRSDRKRQPAPQRGDAGPPGVAQSSRPGHRHSVPRPVVDELAVAAGAARGSRLAAKLADASHAYERERYQEARRILRPLAEEASGSAAVQELYGLVLYRSGQWVAAARHLEAYRALSGEYDQHPVLADCYRALRRYADADELWEDLRQASPDPDLVAEGRIVAAGCRADQGDLAGAVRILERSSRRVDHPQERHLRQWYVLADLAERAGDLPRARELFSRVASADPEAFDVRDRLRSLR